MKGLLISAFATASLFMGVSTISITTANAYSPPHCIDYDGYHYCLSDSYNDTYCIYQYYYNHQYIYCRPYGGGGGSSNY